MQAGFRVVVLALEADRVVDFVDQSADDVAVGAVSYRPDKIALGVGEFLGSTPVVQVVVVNAGLFEDEGVVFLVPCAPVRFGDDGQPVLATGTAFDHTGTTRCQGVRALRNATDQDTLIKPVQLQRIVGARGRLDLSKHTAIRVGPVKKKMIGR